VLTTAALCCGACTEPDLRQIGPVCYPGDSRCATLIQRLQSAGCISSFPFSPFCSPTSITSITSTLLSRNVLRSRGDRHYEELHGAHKRCEGGQQHRDEDRTGCFVRRSSPSPCTRSCVLTRCTQRRDEGYSRYEPSAIGVLRFL